MNRSEMRRCGKRFASKDAASRSKAGQQPRAKVESCRCGGWHVRPAGPSAGTGPNRSTRLTVLRRDGYACVRCGISVVGRPYSLQHRKRRSQGGTNSPSNLIVLCGTGTTGCHEQADSRRDWHDEAKGYTVRSGQDPARVGVMIFSPHGSGVTKWLSEDGAYLDEAPGELAA